MVFTPTRTPSVIQQTRRGTCWIRLITRTTARTALWGLIGLLLWSQLPALLPGWQATVILGGSMRPRIMPADVVLYQHVPINRLRRGQVILVRDPAHPSRLLTHRVHKKLPNGNLITAGDANKRPDSTPVPPTSYLGLGRLRVPWIALPLLWWREQLYWALTATAMSFVVLARASILRI